MKLWNIKSFKGNKRLGNKVGKITILIFSGSQISNDQRTELHIESAEE